MSDGVITEHTRRAYNCLLGSRDSYIADAVDAVCVPCAMKDPIGITVESGPLALPVPMSLQDLTRAKAALETIRAVTDSLVVLGVLDAPAEAPIPDADPGSVSVSPGILERYETALRETRDDEIIATRAANDMRRVFLSDREIQNTGTDQETWEIAVTRAGQIRDQLDDLGSPGLEIMNVIEGLKAQLKGARKQLLTLAATFLDPDRIFADEEAIILAALTATKRGMSPWKLGERVTNAEKAETELRVDLGNVKEERDAAIRAWNEQTVKAAGLSDSIERYKSRETVLEETIALWKGRAEAAERGQPGRYSNPTPPADAPAPEVTVCIGEPDCPFPGHEGGCPDRDESWTRRSNRTERNELTGQDDKE